MPTQVATHRHCPRCRCFLPLRIHTVVGPPTYHRFPHTYTFTHLDTFGLHTLAHLRAVTILVNYSSHGRVGLQRYTPLLCPYLSHTYRPHPALPTTLLRRPFYLPLVTITTFLRPLPIFRRALPTTDATDAHFSARCYRFDWYLFAISSGAFETACLRVLVYTAFPSTIAWCSCTWTTPGHWFVVGSFPISHYYAHHAAAPHTTRARTALTHARTLHAYATCDHLVDCLLPLPILYIPPPLPMPTYPHTG